MSRTQHLWTRLICKHRISCEHKLSCPLHLGKYSCSQVGPTGCHSQLPVYAASCEPCLGSVTDVSHGRYEVWKYYQSTGKAGVKAPRNLKVPCGMGMTSRMGLHAEPWQHDSLLNVEARVYRQNR